VDSEREAAPPEGAAPPLGLQPDAGPAPGAAAGAARHGAAAGGAAEAATHAETPRAAGGGAQADDGAIADADAEPTGDGVVEAFDEAQLRERAGKAAAYLDLAQRTQADFDNYRKRMTREVRAAEARGIGKLARELLPALDNLERALAAVGDADPDHHLSQGVKLLSAELSAALGRAGVQGFSPDGEQFDPSQHEAVAQQPVEGFEPGTVVQVLQSGYRLNESILRPARVIVAG
jgi:molecular chaperone GrpE